MHSTAVNAGRRRLLQAMAAAALVPGIPTGAASSRPHVVVVRAGAFGGWTGLSLARLGARVTLIDAWGPGNSRSSSGGESRVIRAIYGADRIYSELVSQAWDLWTALDATRDEQLLTPTGALWMLRGDDDRYVRSALPIVEELGFPVTNHSPEEAHQRWPQISFDGVRKVFFEERAGALAARRCCAVVAEELLATGGTYRTGRASPVRDPGESLRVLRLEDGSGIEADAFVFACGPWLGRVFPDVLGQHIQPTRQDVFYFGAPAGHGSYAPPALPVWIDFGERLFYGLPDTNGRGFKIADDTRGPRVDPDTLDRVPDPASLDRARTFIAERFPGLAEAPLLEARVCQYENSPDGDLVVDRHPMAKNVWLVGGGSGHGFKLAPALGARLAAQILFDQPLSERFALGRLDQQERTRTQFDE